MPHPLDVFSLSPPFSASISAPLCLPSPPLSASISAPLCLYLRPLCIYLRPISFHSMSGPYLSPALPLASASFSISASIPAPFILYLRYLCLYLRPAAFSAPLHFYLRSSLYLRPALHLSPSPLCPCFRLCLYLAPFILYLRPVCLYLYVRPWQPLYLPLSPSSLLYLRPSLQLSQSLLLSQPLGHFLYPCIIEVTSLLRLLFYSAVEYSILEYTLKTLADYRNGYETDDHIESC
jgi:hypothetical protein